MRNTMNDLADWQWNLNAWSKQDNPAASIQHYLTARATRMADGTSRAFAWLCYGQRHDEEALAAYEDFRAAHGYDHLFASVLKAHGDRTADIAEAAVHLEWQAHSNPRSLLAAVTAWQSTASAQAQIEAMFELLAGQQHNANACQLYRACFTLRSTELFEAAANCLTRLIAGSLSHPYLLGAQPSPTVLRDEVPASDSQTTEPA
jgi:hypothetical protein